MPPSAENCLNLSDLFPVSGQAVVGRLHPPIEDSRSPFVASFSL